MMDYEMDATQALPMDEEEDYEEDHPSDKVVAQLKVLACKGFPETSFDLQEGENIIGRHEGNKIHIPLKSLSKQHACIEIHGESHLIYDMGSRNKTRRGKLFLKPNIRYELKSCDILTLADVTCQYLLPEADGNMSDSSDSIDILQPTQPFIGIDNAKDIQPQTSILELKTPSHDSAPKRVFAEDSDDNDSPSGLHTPGNNSVIPDTQPERRLSMVVQESDSDTDMEDDDAVVTNGKSVNETDLDMTDMANASTQAVNTSTDLNGTDLANASTQAVNATDVNGTDLANASTQAVNVAELETQDAPDADPADMATQAYQATTDEDDNEDGGDKDDMADAATLAYEPDRIEDIKQDIADDATLAYNTEEEDKDDEVSDSALQPTQAFAVPSPIAKHSEGMEDMDTDDSMADEPTQSFVDVPTQPPMNSTQNDDLEDNDPAEAATQAVRFNVDDDEVAPTQAYGDNAEAPTPAYDGDDANAATQAYNGDDAMAATQAYGGDDAIAATQAYGGDDAIAATQAYGGDDAIAATQAYGGDDAMEATQAYGGGDDAEAPTLAYGNEDTPDVAMAATQACTGDDPFAPTQKYTPDDSIAPTQAYGADDDAMAATQAYTDVADMPTLACNNVDLTPTKHKPGGEEKEENVSDGEVDADEPTQAYGLDDVDAPTQAYLNEDDDDDDDMAPTQAYGGTDVADQPTLAFGAGDEEDRDDNADAPTLAYGNEEEEEADTKKSDEDDTAVDVSEEPTQAYGLGEEDQAVDDSEEPTQAYGLVPGQDDDTPAMNDEDEPTQAYGEILAEDDDTPALNDEEEPTQAYGEIPAEDDTEEMPTTSATAAESEEGETQIPDSQDEASEELPNRTRRIESLLAQVPTKSALTSPGREANQKKKVLRVAFKEQTPESEEDSEEPPLPTKRSARGRKAKPIKEQNKEESEKDEGKEEEGDDVDIAPTRNKSFRKKRQSTTDTVDNKTTTQDTTKGKGKAHKKPPTGKKGKRKNPSAGSKKINEYFNKGAAESSDSHDDLPSTSPKKETVIPEPKKLSPQKGVPEPKKLSPPRAAKGKPVSKKGGRKSARRKLDETDTDDTESMTDSLSNVTEIDSAVSSSVTRRSMRGASTVDGKEEKVASGSKKGKKQKKKGVESNDKVETSPVTIEIKIPKMDLSAHSDLDITSEMVKSGSIRKSGRGKMSVPPKADDDDALDKSDVVSIRSSRRGKEKDSKAENDDDALDKSSVVSKRTSRRGKETDEKANDDNDSGKSELPKKSSRRGKEKVSKATNNDAASDSSDVVSKRPSRRGKQNDETNKLTDTDSTPVSKGQKGKKGAKVDDSKMDMEQESSMSEKKPRRGRKRGAKGEQDEESSTDKSKITNNKKGSDKVAADLNISTRTSKRADLAKSDEAEGDEKSDKKSTRNRSRGKAADQTIKSSGKEDCQKAEEDSTSTRSSNRKSMRGGSGDRSQGDEFKKPVPVKKGGHGKAATEDETPSKRSSRRGHAAETVSTPKIGPSRKGKRSHTAEKSPSPSPSPTPSPFPAKRGRQDRTPSPSPSPIKRGRQAATPSSSPSTRGGGTAEAQSPSLRRRTSESKPRVMFTGVTDKEWEKIVTSLGGVLVDSVYSCTHLITDKVRRTVKFLCCLAKGAMIVNPKWLDMCKVNKTFVDPMPFLLQDRPSEKQHKFTMMSSYQKASGGQVLNGKKIHVTPGVKPDPTQMKDIIKCAGGEMLTKLPTKPDANTIIVSCDQDVTSVSALASKGIPVVSAEFILTGMLRQEANTDLYQLDMGPSTSKRRASTQPTHGGKRKR